MKKTILQAAIMALVFGLMLGASIISMTDYLNSMKPPLMEIKDGPGETQKFRLTLKDGTKKCYFKTQLSDELTPTDCADFDK